MVDVMLRFVGDELARVAEKVLKKDRVLRVTFSDERKAKEVCRLLEKRFGPGYEVVCGDRRVMVVRKGG